MRRAVWLGILGILVYGFELLIVFGLEPPMHFRIGIGFLSLFLFPGICVYELFLKGEGDFLERIGSGVVLSLGLFSYPGLLFFVLEASLEVVFWSFLGVGILVWVMAVVRDLMDSAEEIRAEDVKEYGRWLVLGLALISGVMAFYLGAPRSGEHDWDYFNYISMVRKFVVWGSASIHHYFYIDAVPDPIHSYNLLGLLWAVVSVKNRIDPIPLYIHSAFLVVPLCFISFYIFSRRALGAVAGFVGFIFYYFYQVLYGGLYFVGNANFYPDDGMWLLCFPALLSLSFFYIERGRIPGLVLSGFGALGISIIHPLWGLGFYLVLGFLMMGELARGTQLDKDKVRGKSSVRVFGRWGLWILIVAPYLLSLIYIMVKGLEEPREWFKPIISGFYLDRLWFYGLIFVILPGLIYLGLIGGKKGFDKWRSGSEFYKRGYFGRVLILILVSVLVAVPYIYLRYQAVEHTQWSIFGRNPYRGLITDVLFLLNPFKRSFTDPNMSFHPYFWLGLLLSPFLLKSSRDKALGRGSFYAFIGVILLVLHPVLASIFAHFFSLGYLRRILRLAGLLGFLSAGAFFGEIGERFKWRQGRVYLVGGAVSILLSLAFIKAPGEALYSDLLKRMVALAKPELRQSLGFKDSAIEYLMGNNLVKPEEVVYSDIYTSFRLTAYLGCYVGVQHKPGVGVWDQDTRRIEEMEFFSGEVSVERMVEILKKRGASWVIINRNPQYQFYNLRLGHPETVGKLESAGDRFSKVYDKGDWVIFRFLGID